METLHVLPARGNQRELVPLRAALRHQVRYLAARLQCNDEDVDRDVFARHVVTRSPVGGREITLLTRWSRFQSDPGHDEAGHLDYRICDRCRLGVVFKIRTSEEVGHMDYRICDLCRLGVVLKIRTSEEWTRRRYGTWMIDRSRGVAPGYTWTTSLQMSDAQAFWDFAMARTPGQYRQKTPCPHIQAASFGDWDRNHWRAVGRTRRA